MLAPRELRRHDLLRLRPHAWPGVLDDAPAYAGLTGEARALVAGWAARGWPMIARRREVDDPAGTLAIGLPLPPSFGKLRLGFAVPSDAVEERGAPVTLAEAMASAPPAWRDQIDGVQALGGRLGLKPTVFGALLWQHLTGLTYLRPGSDLDLIWPTPPLQQLPKLLDGLAALDADGPVTLDGEITLPDGGGVQWRELHREWPRAEGAVLVKAMDGADLRCTRTLFN